MAYLGEIRMFAGEHVPAGWAFCDGQLLSVAANSQLFAVLGTSFGGNGTTTFALPDLRGRVPIGPGQGAGLTNRQLGEADGDETVTLTEPELPAHTHPVSASSANGSSTSPAVGVRARTPAAIPDFAPAADASLAPEAVLAAGGNQPHFNMQPFLVVTYIIAIQGIAPTP